MQGAWPCPHTEEPTQWKEKLMREIKRSLFDGPYSQLSSKVKENIVGDRDSNYNPVSHWGHLPSEHRALNSTLSVEINNKITIL